MGITISRSVKRARTIAASLRRSSQSTIGRRSAYRSTLSAVANMWAVGYARAFLARHKLGKTVTQRPEIGAVMDLAFSFKCLGIDIAPVQVGFEMEQLLNLLSKRTLDTALEIGTARGGTLFLFARMASPDATLLSIDLPGGRIGGGYPNWKIPLYKSFAKENQQIHLLKADSHEDTTLARTRCILGHRQVDFLFIDGDHAYEGVKKDFQMYRTLVRKGGIIAFHDIVPGAEEKVGGVPKLWTELKALHEYKEIVKTWEQGGLGIGVLFV